MIFLYAYIIIIFIRPQDWVSFFYNWPMAAIILPLGIISGLAANSNKSDSSISLVPVAIMNCYLVVIFISVVSTRYAYGFSSIMPELTMWLQRGCLFFMTVKLINSEKKLKYTLLFLLFILTILAVQAIQQGVTGVGWNNTTPYPGYQEVRVRWIGDWDGPNVYGLILGMAIPIALEFFWNTSTTKIFYIFSISLLSLGVYFTNSRGAVLGIALSFLLQVASKYIKNIRSLIICITILAITISIGGAFLPSRMSNISSGESSAHERTWAWENGLKMFTRHPILGVGKGLFAHYSAIKLRAHNNYVQIFSETGLLGFFFFIGFIWFTISRLWSFQDNESGNNLQHYSRAIIFSLLSYCFTTYFVTMENDALFLLFGLSVAAYKLSFQGLPVQNENKFTGKDFFVTLTGMLIIYTSVWAIAIFHLI